MGSNLAEESCFAVVQLGQFCGELVLGNLVAVVTVLGVLQIDLETLIALD